MCYTVKRISDVDFTNTRMLHGNIIVSICFNVNEHNKKHGVNAVTLLLLVTKQYLCRCLCLGCAQLVHLCCRTWFSAVVFFCGGVLCLCGYVCAWAMFCFHCRLWFSQKFVAYSELQTVFVGQFVSVIIYTLSDMPMVSTFTYRIVLEKIRAAFCFVAAASRSSYNKFVEKNKSLIERNNLL